MCDYLLGYRRRTRVQRVAYNRYSNVVRVTRGEATANKRHDCDGRRPGASSRFSGTTELTCRLVVHENTLGAAIALNMRHRRVCSSGEYSVEHGRRSVRPTVQEQHGESYDTCDRRTIHHRKAVLKSLQLGWQPICYHTLSSALRRQGPRRIYSRTRCRVG